MRRDYLHIIGGLVTAAATAALFYLLLYLASLYLAGFLRGLLLPTMLKFHAAENTIGRLPVELRTEMWWFAGLGVAAVLAWYALGLWFRRPPGPARLGWHFWLWGLLFAVLAGSAWVLAQQWALHQTAATWFSVPGKLFLGVFLVVMPLAMLTLATFCFPLRVYDSAVWPRRLWLRLFGRR